MTILDVTHNEKLEKIVFHEYVRHFPVIEQNTMDTIREYKTKYKFGAFYKIIGIFDECWNCIGGCYYWLFSDINTMVIEFIFIQEHHRGKGLSTKILEQIVENKNLLIVIEVDKGSSAESYWSKLGFSPIDYEYIQPAIVNGNPEYHGLRIWSNVTDFDIEEVIKNHYWKYAFQ